MLKQRMITAAVLVFVLYFAIYHTSLQAFDFVLKGVLWVAGFEWIRLCGINTFSARAIFSTVFLGLLFGLFLSLDRLVAHLGFSYLLSPAVVFWGVLSFLFIRHCVTSHPLPRFSTFVLIPLGYVLFLEFYLGMHLLKSLQMSGYGHLTLYALSLVAAADIGAYFVGRAIGRHKLCVAVSPGKTWEGFFGGVVLSVLTACVLPHFVLSFVLPLPYTLVLSLAVAVVSVVGDLFESHLKRQVGLKDSSQLLPGHGGLLDRLDSLLAAVPLLSFGIMIGISLYT